MLIGRHAECARLDELLEGARRSQGGALVVRGQAGVGKTALLDYAAASPDVRVLRGTGVQAESEFAYASAHQLLRPLLGGVEALPVPQANAIRVALGMAEGSAPDRFLVALGFLSLLSDAARDQPLLCLLDDVQWCDDASTDALRFAERRLGTDPVVFVFSVRDEPATEPVELPGVAELTVSGLSSGAAGELLAATAGVVVAEPVRTALVARTHGNPLALVELARALSSDQLAGYQPLPDPLPVGDRLERAFLDRARRLSTLAQQLLLVAAAEESGETDIVAAAAARLGAAENCLTEAERSGLLSIRASRLEFCHPLARSAIYGDAAPHTRRDAHRALAAVLAERGHLDRRIWHLAAAATGPDDTLAAELEQLAQRATQRSGHAAASAALERGADLSGDTASRATRLVAAASAAWQAGQPDRARALLDRAGPIVSDVRLGAALNHLRGVIGWRCGAVPDACADLLAGAAQIARLDPEQTLEMLADAGLAAWDAGDYPRLAEVGAAAAALPRSADGEHAFLADVLVGSVSLSMGTTDGEVPLVREAIARAAEFDEPRLLVWAAIAAEVAGESELESAILSRGVALARASGAVDRLTVALEATTVQGFLTGHHDVAAEATEGLTLARHAGLPNAANLHLATLAWLAAVQGREDECRTHAAKVVEVARPNGHGIANSIAEWAVALLDLGLGRAEETVTRLLALSAAPPGIGHPYYVLNSAPDLVEACVRTGRHEIAVSAFAVLDEFARPGAPMWALALAARCRALLADGAAGAAEFAGAVQLHSHDGNPFDRARTELLLGEHLRRQRQRSAAREHLRAAFGTFDRLGARPWAERAATELRATGETVQRDRASGLAQLTPQELQIIRQVCRGASNRDVAAQLFISPRTVEYHLYKAYPKLGISSRTQLIRQYGGDGELVAAH